MERNRIEISNVYEIKFGNIVKFLFEFGIKNFQFTRNY